MARGTRRYRVTEQVHVKVERWRSGARKPDTDEIVVKRVRSTSSKPADSIEEMTSRLFGGVSQDRPKALPGKRTDKE